MSVCGVESQRKLKKRCFFFTHPAFTKSLFRPVSIFGLGTCSDLGAFEKHFSQPGHLYKHGGLFESWALNW